jgi:cyclase
MNRAVGSAQVQVDRIRKELAQAKSPEQQEELRRQIQTRQDFLDRMTRLKLAPPLIAFDDSLVITEGERSVELLSPGIGHTDGDIVLFLPAEKIVFAGDLFFNAAVPNTQDGSMLEWIKTLAELLKLDAEQFVPGHGQPGTKDDVRKFRSYLEELKAAVEAGLQRGDSLEQVLRNCRIPPAYTSFQFQNFFPANVQKMYLELKALQPAAPATDETVKKTEPEKTKP